MCISHMGNCRMKILIDGQLVEQVSEFRYLDSFIFMWFYFVFCIVLCCVLLCCFSIINDDDTREWIL